MLKYSFDDNHIGTLGVCSLDKRLVPRPKGFSRSAWYEFATIICNLLMSGVEAMPKHKCANRFGGEGAKGGCYFEIEQGSKEDIANLAVGWSCVVVHRSEIPITWLSELIAIAAAHDGGIEGFLKEHDYGHPSYALMCDPAV